MRLPNKISSFSIIIFFVLFAITGIALSFQLSIRLHPDNSGKVLQVSWNWQDASPEVIEQEVTSKLESSFALLQGINKVESESKQGYGYILLYLNKNVNIDFMHFEVAGKVRQIYPSLPTQVSYPQISNYGGNNKEKSPIISFSLNGNQSMFALTQFAKNP